MMVQDKNESSPLLVVEEKDSVAIIRFNRPKERNPLSIATLTELDQQFSSLSLRDSLKAIIFTGTDDIFASGANIREVASLTPETAKALSIKWQGFFQQIADSPKLTIAAINGYCMGGALDLALSCKIRVASPNAVFAHPGLRLGIITGWGGTQRLSRLIGPARALEIFLTAGRVTAQEAFEFGLVQAVAEPVLEAAFQYL